MPATMNVSLTDPLRRFVEEEAQKPNAPSPCCCDDVVWPTGEGKGDESGFMIQW